MEEELGGNFVIAVDELGITGLWTTIKDVSVHTTWHDCIGTGTAVPSAACARCGQRTTLRACRRTRVCTAYALPIPRTTYPPARARRAGLPRAQLLEARTPLQGLMLSNKFGKPTQVPKLPLT